MSKNPKSAKDVFNLHSANPEVEDPRIVAEKDNTPPSLTPPNSEVLSQPWFSPIGSTPIKPFVSNEDFDIEFTPEGPNDYPINLDTADITLDWEENGYHILVKQEEQPHPEGIDGGRISRLVITHDDRPPINFDHGRWQDKPKLPIEYEMVDNIKEDLNATPEQEVTSFNDPSKKNGHDI